MITDTVAHGRMYRLYEESKPEGGGKSMPSFQDWCDAAEAAGEKGA